MVQGEIRVGKGRIYNDIFQGDLDLSEFGRFKFWTDGARNLVFMGIENCTKADEGVYRCVITNRFGRREHKFKLFISSELPYKILKKYF